MKHKMPERKKTPITPPENIKDGVFTEFGFKIKLFPDTLLKESSYDSVKQLAKTVKNSISEHNMRELEQSFSEHDGYYNRTRMYEPEKYSLDMNDEDELEMHATGYISAKQASKKAATYGNVIVKSLGELYDSWSKDPDEEDNIAHLYNKDGVPIGEIELVREQQMEHFRDYNGLYRKRDGKDAGGSSGIATISIREYEDERPKKRAVPEIDWPSSFITPAQEPKFEDFITPVDTHDFDEFEM